MSKAFSWRRLNWNFIYSINVMHYDNESQSHPWSFKETWIQKWIWTQAFFLKPLAAIGQTTIYVFVILWTWEKLKFYINGQLYYLSDLRVRMQCFRYLTTNGRSEDFQERNPRSDPVTFTEITSAISMMELPA